MKKSKTAMLPPSKLPKPNPKPKPDKADPKKGMWVEKKHGQKRGKGYA